jgi:hypothetical protein
MNEGFSPDTLFKAKGLPTTHLEKARKYWEDKNKSTADTEKVEYLDLYDDAPQTQPQTQPQAQPQAEVKQEEGIEEIENNRGRNLGLLSNMLPYFRPSNQRPLSGNQLMGEMYALSNNQLDPVQAQLYQPLLEQTSDISLQDQMNANQADFNAIQRTVGNNPAALAALAAQKYAANTGVLGEQFRQNQTQKMGVYNRNRGVLNDATLKNLGILDNQYVRQSQARSNTKATAQAALNSISDKIARNKLENRTLGVYENLYNYRFGPRGQAWNVNAPHEFNYQGNNLPVVDSQGKEVTTVDTRSVRRDNTGMPLGTTERQSIIQRPPRNTKPKSKTGVRNGAIVSAIKNL